MTRLAVAVCFLVVVPAVLCGITPTLLRSVDSAVPTAGNVFNRVMLDNAVAEGALCLDGSAGGYYWQPAADAANANNWMLYFEGGGWCYSEADCWGRSFGDLGSSLKWPATVGGGGLISDDCNVNPTWCKYNKVYMKYCDGNSFSGNRAEPVVYKGRNIYFRGKNVIASIIKDITTKRGFGSAENVLLTGCSAGGLATYLHADSVKAVLPASVKKYGVAPISGFFMDYPSVDAAAGHVYGDQMKYIYGLSNAAAGLNDKCVADKKDEDKWQCNMAPYVLPYIESPLFMLNSKYDSWQTMCVLSPERVPADSTDNGHCGWAPNFGDCSKDEEKCSADQIGDYLKFGDAVDAAMTAGLKKGVDGAFLTSCHTHCEAQGDQAWLGFKINGVNMQTATKVWWDNISTGKASADVPVLRDCSYTAGAVKKCNPTCGNQ